jgi:hypothetical protein
MPTSAGWIEVSDAVGKMSSLEGMFTRMWASALHSGNGARDSSRRNASTAQSRPQGPRVFFAYELYCGLKSALRGGDGSSP